MAGVPGIGKRKRAVVVMRTATGEYSTVASPPRPGDGHVEAEPEPVPRSIEIPEGEDGLDPVPAGVRRVDRS
jgi:hypothetical protein